MEEASSQQRRYFFKLCQLLSLDLEKVKDRAKAKYGAESFMDLNKFQMSKLIDILVKKYESKTSNE